MLLRTACQLASPAGRRGRLSVLVFHRVLAEPDPLFPDEPDACRFDEIMAWIKGWFRVLPLDEAVERLRREDLPARAAAVTFDDGYADNLIQALPVLQKHGLHATFFIATGFLDGGRMWNDTLIETVRRTAAAAIDAGFLGLGELPLQSVADKRAALGRLLPTVKHLPAGRRAEAVARLAELGAAGLPQDLMLTASQVRALRAAGMGIGAHTVNHPILATLDAAAARREIADSRDFLQGLLREPVGLFAYPNGRRGSDYTAMHRDMVHSLGFRGAFSTHWGVACASCDPYQLPRFTPWDRQRWRYGFRLFLNYCRQEREAAVAPAGSGAPEIRSPEIRSPERSASS